MNRALLKQQTKQAARCLVGEPYVGKRLKLRRMSRTMRPMNLAPRTILDAGAEDATFVYWLADRYPSARVSAVDIDEATIAACVSARPAKYADRVSFRVLRFADLEPASVDLVNAFDVFEHIEDDLGAARDLWRALRPGGVMLVHVPRNRWRERSGREHRVADEDARQINPGHVRMGYLPESMKILLATAGFDVLSREPWLGRWGTLAHSVYERLEHPTPLRTLTISVTNVCAWLDMRAGNSDGNTVFAHAVKRSS